MEKVITNEGWLIDISSKVNESFDSLLTGIDELLLRMEGGDKKGPMLTKEERIAIEGMKFIKRSEIPVQVPVGLHRGIVAYTKLLRSHSDELISVAEFSINELELLLGNVINTGDYSDVAVSKQISNKPWKIVKRFEKKSKVHFKGTSDLADLGKLFKNNKDIIAGFSAISETSIILSYSDLKRFNGKVHNLITLSEILSDQRKTMQNKDDLNSIRVLGAALEQTAQVVSSVALTIYRQESLITSYEILLRNLRDDVM